MRIVVLLAAFGAAFFMADPAFAQATATAVPDTTVNFGGMIRDTILPLVATVVSGLIGGVLTWAAALFTKATNIKVEDAWRQSIHSAAMTGVNSALAKLGAKADGLTLDLRYQIVAEAAEWMMRSVPDALKGLGLDKAPEKLQELILSKIGLLQQTPGTVETAKAVPNA